jgi:hypothetical protein
MTASVDKSRVYVGQQILLTVQFLGRPHVLESLASQPRYHEPDTTGFLVEPLKEQKYTTNVNGVPYVVDELRYALFPTSDGEFAIGNASIDVAIRAAWDPFDPNSIFQNFFSQGQVAKLTTRAIPIHVQALPKTKPDGFSGAVGRFKLTAKVDSTDLEAGKPFNLIVKVEGVGNIKAIREPVIPELKSFRRYETISSSKINDEGKFLYGSKEFKILLIPQVSGNLTIPSISFPYFNPEQHEYVTDATSPIPLQVKAGNLAAANADRPRIGSNDQPEEGIQVVEKDIRFIKSGTLKPVGVPLASNPIFWVLTFMPPLFALGAALSTYRSVERRRRAGFYRSKEAYGVAKKNLKRAKNLLTHPDSNEFFGTLYSVLVGFLADKLGISESGAVWNEIDFRLKHHNVGDDLRAQVRSIWDETDMARFGITNFSKEEKLKSLEKTEGVLTQLSKIL